MKFGEILCSRTGEIKNTRILGKYRITAPPSDDLHLNKINTSFYNRDLTYQVWFNAMQ